MFPDVANTERNNRKTFTVSVDEMTNPDKEEMSFNNIKPSN